MDDNTTGPHSFPASDPPSSWWGGSDDPDPRDRSGPPGDPRRRGTQPREEQPARTPEPAGTSHWVPAGPLSLLDDDTAVHVDLAGHPVCLARSQGTVHAMLDECSHGQVLLSEGDVEEGYVECWLHGSRFDLTTGVPTGPPAIRPVPVYPVRIIGGDIEVALPARPEGAAHG